MTKFGGKGDLKGLFDTDTNQIYLFTDNLNDDIRDVEFTLFHEIYGHLEERVLMSLMALSILFI